MFGARGDGTGFSVTGRLYTILISYNTHVEDLGNRLKGALSPGEFHLIQRVANEAAARGLPLYMVGGLPRDLVLGRRGTDFDLVVEGDAITLAQVLAAKHGGQVTAHSRFGTAKWVLDEADTLSANRAPGSSTRAMVRDHIDLASARKEHYRHAAELPRVEVGAIDDDLRRRDFTINTLAIRLDGSHFGEVWSHFGALEDLRDGVVRVLHPGSFRDDPTRMYRAVRYEQRYGFKIAPDTLNLIVDARGLIPGLSGQRIRHELDLILDEDTAHLILHRLGQLDLIRPIHPALPTDESAWNRLATRASGDGADVAGLSQRDLGWLLWLMEVSTRDIGSIQARLHFNREMHTALLAASKLSREAAKFSRWKPSRVTAHLRTVPLWAISAVHRAVLSGASKRALGQYLAEWRFVRPTIRGHDLKARGLDPGPSYNSILRDLRDGWLDGEITTKSEETQHVDAWIRRFQKRGRTGGRHTRTRKG